MDDTASYRYTMGVQESDLESFAANDWEINMSLNLAGLYDTDNAESCISIINQFLDAGIKVWLDIERSFGHTGVVTSRDDIEIPLNTYDYFGTTAPSGGQCTLAQFYALKGVYPTFYLDDDTSRYEERLGECFDLFDALPIEGYCWEDGFDTGLTWLRGRTSKKLIQYIVRGDGGNGDSNSSYYLFNYEPFSWRLGLVDAVMFEIYYTSQFSGVSGDMTYMRTNTPTKSIYVTTQYAQSQPSPTRYWWDEPNYADQMGSMFMYFQGMQFGGIAIDGMEGSIGYYNPETTAYWLTPIGRMNFYEQFIGTTNKIDLTNIAYAT